MMSQPTGDEYIKHVVDTAESHDIVAVDDVYSAHGAKLISSGTKIDKSLYEKLVRNKLLRPIDCSLAIEKAVTRSQIVDYITSHRDDNFIISFLLNSFRDATLYERIFNQVTINTPLSVKLTVTREQAPEKFNHSIVVALAALYLGDCEQLSAPDLVNLVSAGLFHDLGEMHLDPIIRDLSIELTRDMRKQIYSHPLIMDIILNEFSEYSPQISRAILEHHERLDGSGYPRGKIGDEISQLGRILAVAELLIVLLEKEGENPDWYALATSAKLNSGKYEVNLIRHLIKLLSAQGADTDDTADKGKQQASVLWRVLLDVVRALDEIVPGEDADESTAEYFVLRHFAALKLQISSAGIQLCQPGDLLDLLADCGDDLGELYSLAEESLYRIKEISDETKRRWPEFDDLTMEPNPVQRWVQLTQELVAPMFRKARQVAPI